MGPNVTTLPTGSFNHFGRIIHGPEDINVTISSAKRVANGRPYIVIYASSNDRNQCDRQLALLAYNLRYGGVATEPFIFASGTWHCSGEPFVSM